MALQEFIREVPGSNSSSRVYVGYPTSWCWLGGGNIWCFVLLGYGALERVLAGARVLLCTVLVGWDGVRAGGGGGAMHGASWVEACA